MSLMFIIYLFICISECQVNLKSFAENESEGINIWEGNKYKYAVCVYIYQRLSMFT